MIGHRPIGTKPLALFAVIAALLGPGPRAHAQSDTELAALIDDLVVANHIRYHQGVLDGYGHVSVHHPTRAGHFLMSPRTWDMWKQEAMSRSGGGKP